MLLLLDRDADRFLAKEAEADGWLVKPLDSFRLRRAAATLLAGGTVDDRPEVIEEVAPADASEGDLPDELGAEVAESAIADADG